MALERVTFTYTYLGVTCQNVIHFHNPDGALSGADIAANLRQYWIPQINSKQASLVVWRQVKVHTVPTADHVPYVEDFSYSNGPSQSDGYWSVMSIVFRIRSETPGRRGRGRFYVAGPINGVLDHNVLNSGYMQNWIDIAANLKTRYIDDAFDVGLVLAISPRPGNGVDFVLASNLQIAGTFGVQRRRNTGVGI